MTPWVLRLLIANVGVFFLQMTLQSLTEWLAFVPVLALTRPWTILTYMFAHGGFGHLFFNMLALFFFGPRLEDRLGGSHFIRLYLISGIVGALFSFIFSPQAAIIGASGSVFGVMLGFAYFWPRDPIYIWGVFPIEARWLIAFMTVMALWGGVSGGGIVAHFAHLGGFVGGWGYLRLMRSRSSLERFRRQARPVTPKIETSAGAMERWSRIRRDNLHEVNRDELDRILDKISAKGINSLTPGEREFLDRFSTRH
ncbi:MAG TPA: rhomboid family intramembrane serine protease [Gemmatimonadales bacterium]|nr:rhomboid family intramembrane serine protease [Gemmatimonadales bacterium]